MSKTIFILWKETEREFDHWHYAGGGEVDPKFREVEVTRRLRYSTEHTPEMMKRAEDYLTSEQPDGWIEIIDE